MAAGLLRPDGGTVRIFGWDVWADPVAAKALIGVRLAQQRLESHGPEIFARVRAPAS